MTPLDKIRNKSDSEKKTFALVSAFLITVVIVVVWVFTNIHTLTLSIPSLDETKQSASPLESIGFFISNLFSGGVATYKSSSDN